MYFSEEESTSSRDDDDDDLMLESTNQPPAPIQHNAKTLRLGMDESSDQDDDNDQAHKEESMIYESDEEEEEENNEHKADADADSDSNSESEFPSEQIPSSKPRGKVLRIPSKQDDISDDDDNDNEEEPQTAAVMAEVEDDDQDSAVLDTEMGDELSVAETSIFDELESNITTATPVKEDDGGELAVAVAVDTEGDADPNAAVAAVVMDGNESETSEVAAVAEVVAPKKVRKKPGPKPKKKEKGRSSSSKKKSGGGGKRRKRDSEDHVRDHVHISSSGSASTISREKLDAAQKARDILLNSAKETSFKVSESHIIRNFGRIKVEDKEEPYFSNATSLFPVGFSCDRFEFSPVHGRELKLRCEILDRKDYADGDAIKDGKSNAKSPIFRITWGQGIDEIDHGKPFPFDLYSASAPLGNEVDTVAVPMGLDVPIVPEPEMRVKVRFDDDVWYRGTITKVEKKTANSDTKEKKKKRGTRSAKKNLKNHFSVKILYDDGMKEEVFYPDPDVVLVAPGK